MDAQKASEIIAEAVSRLEKEAGCSIAHTYTVRAPGSTHEVHVLMFSDSSPACEKAIGTIRAATGECGQRKWCRDCQNPVYEACAQTCDIVASKQDARRVV